MPVLCPLDVACGINAAGAPPAPTGLSRRADWRIETIVRVVRCGCTVRSRLDDVDLGVVVEDPQRHLDGATRARGFQQYLHHTAVELAEAVVQKAGLFPNEIADVGDRRWARRKGTHDDGHFDDVDAAECTEIRL